MLKRRPLAVAVTAFLLGILTMAGLTSVAHAQGKPSARKPAPKYHIVTNELDMNKYAAQGYEVKEAKATASAVWYLMQRTQ